MPSRKLVRPSNNAQDRAPEPKLHRQFTDVFEDEPSTDVPDGTVCRVINAIAAGNKVRPRNGSVLWTNTLPPGITGRSGYSAHTSGEYIISDSGAIFTKADVSCIWHWGNGICDEIVEWISATRVRRRDTDTQSGTTCWMQGRLNLQAWHKTNRRWLIQLGDEFYVANYRQTLWTKVLVDCHWAPANSESTFREDGDYAIVANSRFIYRVLFDGTPPIAYPLNMPVIDDNFTSNSNQGRKRSRYNYLIGMARLDGTGNFRNRQQDPPPKILTESGTTRIDENRKDWSEISVDDPIGDGAKVYGQLDGGPGLDTNITAWENITDGTFNISINNTGFVEILVDFGDCRTMVDIAKAIEYKLQQYWAGATFEYVGDDGVPRFRVTSGKVDGGTVSFVYDGVGGTDIAAELFLRQAEGAIQSNPTLGEPVVLRNAIIPATPWLNAVVPQHWPTHYIVYRSPDYGPVGYHLDELGERVVNSPDMYIWDKDLRICGSFIARRHNGYIELRSDDLGGEFEMADQGCVVEFEDGSRTQILDDGYVNSKLVRYSNSGAYYGDDNIWMAANIGDGRVARVSQSGDVVTVYPGSSTTSFGALATADVGKRIYWPNGYYSYIKSRISATEWQVYDSIDRLETAAAIDPEYRAYCDIVSDVDLLDRASGWACRSRFMREVQNSNLVCRQPSFMVFGARGGKEAWYCPTNPYYNQHVGYHNREFQVIKLQDKLQAFWDFTNIFSAFCHASIYSANTNSSTEISIPETQQKVWQIQSVEKRADVGIIDHGAIAAVGRDMVRFVTNMHDVLDFNGWDFGGEYTTDATTGMKKWYRSLHRSYPIFAAVYSRVTGYLLWWIRDRRVP